MISLLINTKDRYENLIRILETQISYPIIGEVIVFNNGNGEISIQHEKLRVIKANFDVGLRSRWILGIVARSNCVCVQDDDLVVSEDILKSLYANYQFDNDKLYGVFGRRLNLLDKYEKNFDYSNCEVDIALTRLACFDRKLIPFILEAEERVLPFRFPSAQEFPYDDILLSYTALALYNKKPYIISREVSDITELDDVNGLHKKPNFLDARQDIVRICKSRLSFENVHDISAARA